MNRKKKICLLSDHHVSINPRLWKEAFFYEKEGYEVVILTMWKSADLLKKDFEILSEHKILYKSYLNIIPEAINPALRFFYRLRKRAASEMQRYLKIGTGWAISHAPELLVKKAFKEQADIYSAHLECGFFAGRELIKLGKKVSFDFEDWYSRDYLTPDRAVTLLHKLEKFALEHGAFCTAASQAMADALAKVHHNSKKYITTIYNSFPDEELKVKITDLKNEKQEVLKLIWTSRTVGPNRGLETLLEALKLLQRPLELHIIGECAHGYKEFLLNNYSSDQKHKLVFYDFIKHADLLQTIATFDVGLAIERYQPDSRNKTVTNKILQYLQAGIQVLATDTDGQKEIAAYFPGSVFLVEPDNPEQWKDLLEKINSKNSNLEVQLKTYNNYFSWPKQEEKLRQLIISTI